jgi:hypothetical protein
VPHPSSAWAGLRVRVTLTRPRITSIHHGMRYLLRIAHHQALCFEGFDQKGGRGYPSAQPSLPALSHLKRRRVIRQTLQMHTRRPLTPVSAPARAAALDRVLVRATAAASPGPARDSAGVVIPAGGGALALSVVPASPESRRHRQATASRVRCAPPVLRRLRAGFAHSPFRAGSVQQAPVFNRER